MTQVIRKLGIMGGTFDPVHYGHLVAAEGARREFGLDRVIFLPSGTPPHKDPREVTSAEHRYMMTVLATLSNPYFDVSRVDIDREGVTYTVDSLRILHEQYGDSTELYFITGADAILEIVSWKQPDKLLELAQFIGATRPGFSLDRVPKPMQEWLNKYPQRVHFIRVPALAISSTDIRERVKAGDSIRYLVPEPVEHYIRRHNLYRQSI
ncbi:MAG: nicotinate-nucleotide adenylyltransferase [Limnochordia bacterium]